MLPDTLSFVDVETTGTNATYNRIIEIGIIRVQNNRIVAKFNSLVNPETYLDPFIQSMTGIYPTDLEHAPTFYAIKDDILSLLTDSLFVAHNARFDYGFIKNEFKRMDISFSQKQLCTVKLARQLYPQLGKYNLDSIANAFGISIKNRHRAFDDAQALWHFYKKAQRQIGKHHFTDTITSIVQKPTIPPHITQSTLDTLPQGPGVYIFYGDNHTPLYIGKSIHIYDRVLSHFASDHANPKEMKLSQQVKHIETIQTDGELGALLLESSLIKKYKPLYNRALRDAHAGIAVKKTVTQNGYFSVETVIANTVSTPPDTIIAFCKSERQTKELFRTLAKDFYLCHKLLGLEKTDRACFSHQLGICRGACIGIEKNIAYNMRFVQAFASHKIRQWPFSGPICICEGNSQYIFDHWCADNEPFDYDTYKILVRFLLNKNNQKKIKVVQSPHEKNIIYR